MRRGHRSTLTFTVGLGLPVVVLRNQVAAPVPLLAWPGGAWESSPFGAVWVPTLIAAQGSL